MDTDRDMQSLQQRVGRIEAELAIRSLPSRYARAADARDIGTLVGLFVDDVDCGSLGRGREVLAGVMTDALQRFYRSIHMVCCQVIDEIDGAAATGTTYCRAEQEAGGRWMVTPLMYVDRYEQRDGQWLFARRVPRLWYAADILERPGDGGFHTWPEMASFKASLPATFRTWDGFWSELSNDDVATRTVDPVRRHPA